MTQPVQEPTQGRVNQGASFRVSQLARRPAAVQVGGVPDAVAILFADGVAVNGLTSIAWELDSATEGFLDLGSATAPAFSGPGVIVVDAYLTVDGVNNRRCAMGMTTAGSSTFSTFLDGYNDGYALVGDSRVTCGCTIGKRPNQSDSNVIVRFTNFASGAETVTGELVAYRLPSMPDTV